MAKEQTDRTILDLSAHERRPGRPKANPLSRDEQLHINKHNQLKRDRVRDLKRVKPKPSTEAVKTLSGLTKSRNMGHSGLIEEMLIQRLVALYSQDIV